MNIDQYRAARQYFEGLLAFPINEETLRKLDSTVLFETDKGALRITTDVETIYFTLVDAYGSTHHLKSVWGVDEESDLYRERGQVTLDCLDAYLEIYFNKENISI